MKRQCFMPPNPFLHPECKRRLHVPPPPCSGKTFILVHYALPKMAPLPHPILPIQDGANCSAKPYVDLLKMAPTLAFLPPALFKMALGVSFISVSSQTFSRWSRTQYLPRSDLLKMAQKRKQRRYLKDTSGRS